MRKEKGNGYLLEFRCDRCHTKFWDKGAGHKLIVQSAHQKSCLITL